MLFQHIKNETKSGSDTTFYTLLQNLHDHREIKYSMITCHEKREEAHVHDQENNLCSYWLSEEL